RRSLRLAAGGEQRRVRSQHDLGPLRRPIGADIETEHRETVAHLEAGWTNLRRHERYLFLLGSKRLLRLAEGGETRAWAARFSKSGSEAWISPSGFSSC